MSIQVLVESIFNLGDGIVAKVRRLGDLYRDTLPFQFVRIDAIISIFGLGIAYTPVRL